MTVRKTKKQSSYFTTIIPFVSFTGLVFLIIILIFILFFRTNAQKYDAKKSTSQSESQQIEDKKETYQIIDGSLYTVQNDGQKELFVDKRDLHDDELTTIEIESFVESPDKSKLLVLAFGGITPSVIYIVEKETRQITRAGYGYEAVWSPDSGYVAYNAGYGDVGPKFLHIFDTANNTSTLYNKFSQWEKTDFSDLRWSDDGNYIHVNYLIRESLPNGKMIDQGERSIKIEK